MKNTRLLSAWRIKKIATAYVLRHSHDYHELVYYMHAEGITNIDEKGYGFSSGHFAFIPKDKIHDEFHNSEGCLICVGFEGDCDLKTGVYCDKDGELLRVINTILSEIAEQKAGYEDMLRAKLCEMIVLATRLSDKSANTHVVKDFTYAMSYIRENIDEKDVLKKASEGFYQSYDYFRHCFKAQTGFSPRDYLMLCRFQAAKQMLKETNLSCTEISFRCGFCSGAQFASMFKTKYGCTPSEYRERL